MYYLLSITYLMFVGYSSGVYMKIVLYEPVILNFPTRVKMVEHMTIAELPSVERNKRTMSDLPLTQPQIKHICLTTFCNMCYKDKLKNHSFNRFCI